MTPEEKAVIDAAQAVREQTVTDPYSPPVLGDLLRAVDTLTLARRVTVQESPVLETQHPAEWTPTVWGYVQRGDRVRLNGQEADIIAGGVGDWHTEVSSWKDKVTGKMRDNVTGAWDRREANVRLRLANGAEAGPYTFADNLEIEILMSRERKAVHLLATEMNGTVLR
jgi:hypothetical protein